jgi:uncharacterized membrane protein
MATDQLDTTDPPATDPSAPETVEPAEPAEPATPRRRRIFGPLGFGGSVVGVLFLWQSFFPTLMPRTWVIQGVISGVCFALGYLIGAGIGAFVRWVIGAFGWTAPARLRRPAWIALAVGAAVVLVIALVFWPRWQNDQRDLLAMDHIGAFWGLPVLVVAAVVAAILVVIGRLVARGAAAVDRFNHRHLPSEIAGPVTVVLFVVVAFFLLQDVAAKGFTSWANSAFSVADTGTDDGIEQPTSPLVSGSPESLVAWDDLGRQGRTFVATAQTPERIAEFAGDQPVEGPSGCTWGSARPTAPRSGRSSRWPSCSGRARSNATCSPW